MTGLRNSILYALIATMLLCCSSKKEMDRESYLNYLNSEESGLLVTKTLNGITYQLKCLMPEQLCLKLEGVNARSQNEFNELLKQYQDKLNFILLIKDDEGSEKVKSTVFDKTRYGEVMGYANSELNKEIILETEQGEIQSGLLHMESANSLQPILRINLSFHGIKDPKRGFTLVFRDNIFSSGPVKFNFSREIFDQLPKLNIQSI